MTNKNEQVYLDSLRHVRKHGEERIDRTGVGTIGVFGPQTRYDLRESFPLLTTKEMILASVSSELIWFLEGSTDERRLAEIRFGKDRSELVGKKTIWTANALDSIWRAKTPNYEEGELGRVYGAQWRKWVTPIIEYEDCELYTSKTVTAHYIDQIDRLIHGLKKDPYGRRHIVSAWNPGELNDMALPPCHILFQCYVHNGNLDLLWHQRSVDKFLGEPYNIASYGLLTRMIAQVCDLAPRELIHNQGDSHIYLNHRDAVDTQLLREPFAAPQIKLDESIKHIDDFKVGSFELINYQSHPSIKAPMAV